MSVFSGILAAAAGAAIAVAGDATPQLAAPLYGRFLASQTGAAARVVAILAAALLVRIFTAIGRVPVPVPVTTTTTGSRFTIILVTAALLVALSPAAVSVLAPMSGELGPLNGPLVADLPVLLATMLLASWIILDFGYLHLAPFGVISFRYADTISNFVQTRLRTNTCASFVIATLIISAIAAAQLYYPPALFHAPQAVQPPAADTQEQQQQTTAQRIKNAKKGKKAAADSPAFPATAWSLLAIPIAISLYINGGFSDLVLQCSSSRLPHNVPASLKSYSLIAHAESVSGFVSVVEAPSKNGPIRLMRCDHSILGGIYLDHNKDSIFGSFYFLDFARFIRRKPESAPTPESPARALQLGLGIGVTVSTMARAGVLVDVAELDPVVVKYATDHFDMPKPNSVFIGDGRKFIDGISPTNTYDYVLHDVFTGGLVPAHLFTVEAFDSIRRILKPDGILAMNFVGRIDNNATIGVISTLRHVFPNIECFVESRDMLGKGDHMYNMVFFASADPITFKPPTSADLAVGGIYSIMLSNFNDWRVTPEELDEAADAAAVRAGIDPESEEANWMVTDENNPLQSLQLESAHSHWHVMRSLFPAAFWTHMF